MLLAGKVAVIFGGSGAIGSAVAHAMAREGAHVYLGARSQEKLDWAASSIRTAGGAVETFVTDVLDEYGTSKQVTHLAQQTGGIDVVVNATGFRHEQGKRIEALSLSEFMSGITPFLSAQFNIAKAITPHMGGNRAGVILTVVAPAARWRCLDIWDTSSAVREQRPLLKRLPANWGGEYSGRRRALACDCGCRSGRFLYRGNFYH